MHLVGFTIEIYYNAWLYERQKCNSTCGYKCKNSYRYYASFEGRFISKFSTMCALDSRNVQDAITPIFLTFCSTYNYVSRRAGNPLPFVTVGPLCTGVAQEVINQNRINLRHWCIWLVLLYIEIHYDARPYERQICNLLFQVITRPTTSLTPLSQSTASVSHPIPLSAAHRFSV